VWCTGGVIFSNVKAGISYPLSVELKALLEFPSASFRCKLVLGILYDRKACNTRPTPLQLFKHMLYQRANIAEFSPQSQS